MGPHDGAPASVWQVGVGVWWTVLVNVERGLREGASGGGRRHTMTPGGDTRGAATGAVPVMLDVFRAWRCWERSSCTRTARLGTTQRCLTGKSRVLAISARARPPFGTGTQWPVDCSSRGPRAPVLRFVFFLQRKLFFDLIDFANYFQQKQILTLKILSPS